MANVRDAGSPLLAAGALLSLLSLASSDAITAQSNSTPGTCQAFSIQCPITGACGAAPTGGSAFGTRIHPVSGVVKMHWGVDFAVATGTSVRAVAPGQVEESALSATLGNYIVLRHQNGSATLYAHLNTRAVTRGTQGITAGQVIGTSDGERGNPGAGTSTGPHLHFEYVPNGQLIASPSRVDPFPCIGSTVNGSIRVSDNGTLADDAYRITLDGVILGETAIGAANNFAANSLISGNHTLSLTTIVAPDDIGTYQIDLANGIKFSDGTTSKSGRTTRGQTVTFTIIVP